SSRRRHTRSKRDWSSDVCSSDLKRNLKAIDPAKYLVVGTSHSLIFSQKRSLFRAPFLSGYFRPEFIFSSAILIIRLTISPPTDPFSRAVVSSPGDTFNSVAISCFNLSTALSALGTNKSFLSLFAIVDHSSGI